MTRKKTTPNPPCEKCGAKTWKSGHRMYSEAPHKRRKYICTECGHSFVPQVKKDEQETKKEE